MSRTQELHRIVIFVTVSICRAMSLSGSELCHHKNAHPSLRNPRVSRLPQSICDDASMERNGTVARNRTTM